MTPPRRAHLGVNLVLEEGDRGRMTKDLQERYTSLIDIARNDLKSALKESEKLLDKYGDQALAWHASSYVHLLMEDNKKALFAIEKAIEIEPNQSQGYFKAGRLSIKNHLFEKAIAQFGKVIDSIEIMNRSEFLEESRIHRSFCMLKLDRFEAALEDLNQIEDPGPIWIDRLWTKDELIATCQQGLEGLEK